MAIELTYPESRSCDFGLTVEWRGGCCVLTLDRPQKLNAMTSQFFASFGDVVDAVVATPELRSVVLTGAGGNFSAGGDIGTFQVLDSAEAHETHLRVSSAALRAMDRIPVPTIAAVEGIAFAGGMELAAACDVVIAGDGAHFALSEAAVGLLPGVGLRHLARIVGDQRAKWLGMTSEPITAAVALQWGLAHAVVETGEAVQAALDVAARFDTLPADAVRTIKRFVDDRSLTLDDAVALNTDLMQLPAHSEAVAAFFARKAKH